MTKNSWLSIAAMIFFAPSCRTVFFPAKSLVLEKATGVLVFIDDSSRKDRNLSGHVYTDSLVPDFFIPYKFKKRTVTGTAIKNAFFDGKDISVNSIAIRGDCDDKIRKLSISESTSLIIDNEIDNYVASKKLYLLPVEITYLHGMTSHDYLSIHKEIIVQKNRDSIKFVLKKGHLDILRLDVLEYEWSSFLK